MKQRAHLGMTNMVHRRLVNMPYSLEPVLAVARRAAPKTHIGHDEGQSTVDALHEAISVSGDFVPQDNALPSPDSRGEPLARAVLSFPRSPLGIRRRRPEKWLPVVAFAARPSSMP